MSTNPGAFIFVPPAALNKQAATPAAGFALQNATPTIIQWTAPNDGQLHRVEVFLTVNVSSAETGGGIQWTYTDPAGGTKSVNMNGGGQAAGSYHDLDGGVVGAGTTVSISQSSALTAGAANAYAEIWGL